MVLKEYNGCADGNAPLIVLLIDPPIDIPIISLITPKAYTYIVHHTAEIAVMELPECFPGGLVAVGCEGHGDAPPYDGLGRIHSAESEAVVLGNGQDGVQLKHDRLDVVIVRDA